MIRKLIVITICAIVVAGSGNLFAQERQRREMTQEQFDRQKARMEEQLNSLNKPDYFKKMWDAVPTEGTYEERLNGYRQVVKEIYPVLELQAELEWINPKAMRDQINAQKRNTAFDTAKAEELVAKLEQLSREDFSGIYEKDEKAMARVEEMLELKRQFALLNPDIDFDKLVTVKYNQGDWAHLIMAERLGIQPNNWSNQTSASRNGFKAELTEISGFKNGKLEIRTLFTPPVEGAPVTDLIPHWDGERMLITSLDSLRRWQVFEIAMDGTGFRKVIDIDEPDLEFFDATYLPDGRIIAVCNLGYHGVPCVNGSDEVGNMVLYNPSDNNLRRITFDQDANWNPVVLSNGKVMYTRWEYTDLTHYFSRIVMHMNPDGTEQKSLYGSGSMFPNSIFDMKPLPTRTNRFVGVISGHHGVARSGRLMIFDPAKSRKEEQGMIQELPFKGREIIPEIKDELVNDVWPQFIKPYPVSDDCYLVTAKLSPYSRWGIYMVDTHDNLTLLANADESGLIYSIPVKAEKTPPVIPDRVNLADKESTIFIQDIYEGEGLPGVPRGEVKAIRIYAYEYAYQKTLSDHYNHGIQAGWDIKRLLGTVPVEEDGSALFKIPANTPVSLQPLDSEGRAIQWMRSWVTGMPGEIVSCVGCHEDQNKIPIPKKVIASAMQPHPITPAEGGVRSYTFAYEIQPMLDRTCVACHDGSVDSRPNFKDTSTVGISDWSGTRQFQKSYLAFHPYVNRQGPEADMYVMTPYEYHASTSEVVRMLKRGHYGVELTDQEWDKLYTWIDLNAPGTGWFDADSLKGFDQYRRRIELGQKYASGASPDWRKELEDYVAQLKPVQPATITPPEQTAAQNKQPKVKGWPMSEEAIREILAKEKGDRKEIEIADGISITFVRVPAGKFVMGSTDSYPNEAPLAAVEIKKGFWMAEKELTNAQYNALVPEHDSRIYAQFWKDHTTPGYPANDPDQPVIRVSYQEAMDYCNMLSRKTGLAITLPTEAQWEWACRGGSDQPFWYGDLQADFSRFENLADVQLEKMAVTGIDPQPMSKQDPWFNYYNYLPKIASIDDGMMIPMSAYNYQANPFGLINMHGNLAEWTRSAYLPYPYNEKNQTTGTPERIVARGGSWLDRPKDATATVRKDYLPWQKVNNVGIRLIIED